MKQCRIMVTTRCNLSCPYCLMKNKQLMSTIRPIGDISEILAHKYSSYCITGGEPLCDYQSTQRTLTTALYIRIFDPGKPIYLYTNGVNIRNLEPYITDSRGQRFDGINISPHLDVIPYSDILWANRYVPVRLHRRDVLCTPELLAFCAINEIPLKAWHLDSCETVPEDRFLLK